MAEMFQTVPQAGSGTDSPRFTPLLVVYFKGSNRIWDSPAISRFLLKHKPQLSNYSQDIKKITCPTSVQGILLDLLHHNSKRLPEKYIPKPEEEERA